MEPGALGDLLRSGARGALVEATAAAHRLGAEHEVLERGERADEHEMLVDHADPAADGLGRRRGRERPIADEHPAARGRYDPRGELEQRRLAGAVLADDGVDLPGERVASAASTATQSPMRRVTASRRMTERPSGREHSRVGGEKADARLSGKAALVRFRSCR